MHFPAKAGLFPAISSSVLPWPVLNDLGEWGEAGGGNLLVLSRVSLSSLNNIMWSKGKWVFREFSYNTIFNVIFACFFISNLLAMPATVPVTSARCKKKKKSNKNSGKTPSLDDCSSFS